LQRKKEARKKQPTKILHKLHSTLKESNISYTGTDGFHEQIFLNANKIYQNLIVFIAT